MKILTPKGFKVRIEKTKSYFNPKSKHPESVYFYLIDLHTGKKIGNVNLQRYRGKYTTHSFLNEKYHNKGLGIFLYAKAIAWCIKNNYRVTSSGSSSYKAKTLWESSRLREYFHIKKRSIQKEPIWYVYKK